MTEKDYKIISQRLYEMKAEYGDNEILQVLLVKLTESFEKDNPNFNQERFWIACGY